MQDWAAVGAARPVQVAFRAEEDMQRFGKRRRLTKRDHERLHTDTATATALPLRHRAREDTRFEGVGGHEVHEDLEIRIDGRRLGQQYADIDGDSGGDAVLNGGNQPISQAGIVSSQSMLLDEDSHNSYRGRDGEKTQGANRNNALRGSSGNGLQPDTSEASFMPDLQLDDQGLPVLLHRNLSGSMETDTELISEGLGCSVEPLQVQSNESTGSSIITHPESPVRRRFTIDDQAVAERQGRFGIPSSINEPKAGPRIKKLIYHQGESEHGESSEVASPAARRPMYRDHGPSMQVPHDGRLRARLGASPQPHSLDVHSQQNDMFGRLAPGQTYSNSSPSTRILQDGQFEHEGSPEAFLDSSLVPPKQTESRLSFHGQLNDFSKSRPMYPHFGWLPQVHQRTGKQIVSNSQPAKPSTTQSQPHTSSSWSKNANERYPLRTYGQPDQDMHHPGIDQHAAIPRRRDHTGIHSSLRIFGQPVVFEDSKILTDGHTTGQEPPDMELDVDNTNSSFSSRPCPFPSR
ncbi:uncharacterized protein BDV17DRAFT_20327 [Aspergillus undulatus]|uniref:uncharacterized protein n=1 Tax=Aspergillus undulatus TaxID=1810928 RepID=UPI003CCD7B58